MPGTRDIYPDLLIFGRVFALQKMNILFSPLLDAVKHRTEFAPDVRELIFYARGHLRVDGSCEQALSLHFFELGGEGGLCDVNAVLNLTESLGPFLQLMHDQDCPFSLDELLCCDIGADAEKPCRSAFFFFHLSLLPHFMFHEMMPDRRVKDTSTVQGTGIVKDIRTVKDTCIVKDIG